MAVTTVRGQFVWHDLLTPNPAGAHEFYGKTVGWKKRPWQQDPSYLLFAAPSGPVGGAVEAPTATPQWVPYISTADVDDTVQAATRLGAGVQTQPTPLPNGGRYAVLIDPQGASFGIHASAEAAQPAKAARVGEFSWHELATNVAPGIAFGFYGALFDWDEISQTDMGPMGVYLIFGRQGRQLGGMFDKGAAGKPGSAYWLGYVSVGDLDSAVERAKSARGSVLTGPMDVPGGDRIVQLMDPYGAFFALHEAAAARASGEAAAGKPAGKRPAKKPPARKAGAPTRRRPRKAPKPVKPARAKARKKPAARKKQGARKKPAKPAKAKKAAKKAAKRRR